MGSLFFRSKALFLGVAVINVTLLSCEASATKQVKSTIEQRARDLHGMALKAFENGQLEQAANYWQEAAPLFEQVGKHYNVAVMSFNVGDIRQKQSRFETALDYFNQALIALRREPDLALQGDILYRVGRVQTDLGRPDPALSNLEEALGIFRKLGKRDWQAKATFDIGFVYNQLGRYQRSLDYLQDSVQLFEQNGDRLGVGMARMKIQAVKMAIASEQIDRGENEEALATLGEAMGTQREDWRLALEALQESNKARYPGITFDTDLTSKELFKFGISISNSDSNLVFLHIARLVSRRLNKPGDEAKALYYIGSNHSDADAPYKALAYLDSALTIQRKIGDRLGMSAAYSAIARVYFRRVSSPNLDLALAYYDSAAFTASMISEAAGSDPNRLSFIKNEARLYGEWVLASLATSGRIGAERARMAALAVAERGRAQALLRLLRGSVTGAKPGVDLSAEGMRSLSNLGSFNATILDYNVTADTLLIWLIQPNGRTYLERVALASETKLEQVAGKIPIFREGLLRLNARAFLADRVAAFRTDLGVDDAAALDILFAVSDRRDVPRLESLDQLTRNLMALNTGQTSGEHGARLAELLFPPGIHDRLPPSGNLIILPHGPLNMAPFAALKLPGSSRPLGLTHALSYAPSLAVLRETQKRARANSASDRKGHMQNALIVGNPEMPVLSTQDGRKIKLQPLGGAAKEANWLAGKLNQTMLSGANAAEGRILKQAANKSLLHFATHGYAFATETQARNSFIALAPSPGYDGLLTVGELLDDMPKLSADLVVLSACQTGLGNIDEAEGTVGLQRAFLAKGAASVLVSLWNISDSATELLMKSFYSHWLDDPDHPNKAESLRRAQKDVYQIPEFSHPRFWAAFQLVGAH